MMRFLVCGAVCGAALGVFARPTFAEAPPTLRSKAAVVLDARDRSEIFAKDADEIRPIASTTKIFVAMVVRKRDLDLDAWTKITQADVAEARGGARTRLDRGEAFRNRDLLRAMLIASDNRAPTALGRAVGLDPDELVAAMNKLAKELGLAHTRFTSASGLRGNTSTARELATALAAALADDLLRDIMRTEEVTVRSKDGARIEYRTTNAPLVEGRYDVIGGKTGYTEAAGYCFVTAARIDRHPVVMAFLGAAGKETRFADFNRIAGWLETRGVTAGTRPKQRERESGEHRRVANP